MRTALAASLLALVLGPACAPRDPKPPPPDPTVLAQLDAVTARLLTTRARVAVWRELAGRHQQVSAVACAGQEAHAMAMAEQRERRRLAAEAARGRRQASAPRPAQAPTAN